MILQSLVEYYEALAASGKADRPGWGLAKASYALCITDNGELTEVVPLLVEQPRGKKTVLAPRAISVPAPVKRSSGVLSNFMCDNSSYILGVDAKGKEARARECFDACRALHEELLKDADCSAAKAILKFFAAWEPEKASAHPALAEKYDDIISGAGLVFRYGDIFAHEYPEIINAWQTHYDSDDSKNKMVCLVTGRESPVARLHPSIKGVPGAQPSGASLVSFNAESFCSYDREQGSNAPTGEYAAFAYGTALNYLVADRLHTNQIGDTLVLCWSAKGERAYQDAFCAMMFGQDHGYTETELRGMMTALCKGEKIIFDTALLDPDMDFYVLGLAPNAARLSVRFFYHNSFGAILQNVNAHYERMSIVTPSYEQHQSLPLWRALNETVNQNSRDKSPSPVLAGEMIRAVLTGSRYPATLINAVELRIRAEHDIPWRKAAIIKAYYTKNTNPDVPKEVLTVSLNPESDNIAYNLGRLFSVLEAVQEKANPGINATIKDKYFNSASATPAVVFPVLINLAQKHLKKLDGGIKVYCEKQLGDIAEKIGEEFPAHMTLPQQGAFQLGYYHQTQARYQRKDKED